jgi:Xaa-Pro aminopeptidase
MTEKEAAWQIERAIRENGSDSAPFEIIVASGPRSALPHAKPTERSFLPNEPIIIDMGARVGGYCSDLSRTICLSFDGDSTFTQVYDIVLKAQRKAIEGIHSGMSAKQADAIARSIIEQCGYGPAFGHSLGHGIGLAPHESPFLGPTSQDILTDGMVFTIEPGIYLKDWGGVRIEDTAVMENGNVKILSKANKIRPQGEAIR